MERFIDHCCEKCTHCKEKPCPDFVLCRMDGPICHSDASCVAKRKAIVDKVRLNEKFVIL